jgi:hypothetical protein
LPASADLVVTTLPDAGGHRYHILLDDQPVLTSGVFSLEADARRCGTHVASDPKALFDFLER